MPEPKNHTLTLPTERVLQLSSLLEETRLRTFSNLLGQLIRAFEMQNPKFKVDLPGVTATPTTHGAVLKIEGLPELALSREDAHAFANTIRDFVNSQRRGGFEDPKGRFRLSKKGNGIRVEVRDGEAFALKTYSPDIAEELAEHLEYAATPATETAAA